jgi:hypothetical protein
VAELGDAWQQSLQKPLTLLLGDQDIDPNDKNLRNTPEAVAQGMVSNWLCIRAAILQGCLADGVSGGWPTDSHADASPEDVECSRAHFAAISTHCWCNMQQKAS